MAIADQNVERMNMIKGELGDRVVTFTCDVTKEADVKAAIEGTVNHYGVLHVALACAGVAWPMLTYSPKRELDMKTF